MRWLLDNNVPRGVLRILRDEDVEVLEVRAALAQDATDAEVAAYAAAGQWTIVTHDRGLARRALALGIPHVWLRTRESEDAARVEEEWEAVSRALAGGAVRVVLFRRSLRAE